MIHESEHGVVMPRNAVPRRFAERLSLNLVLASAISVTVALALALTGENLFHWFVLPVVLCGALAGADGLAVLRRQRGPFDPGGVMGLLGFHFFYLAPLLHVYWNSWMTGVEPPTDWRDWLGAMATLNAAGLMLYRLTRTLTSRSAKGAGGTTVSRLIERRRLVPLMSSALVMTAAAQMAVYASFGGIIGYMAAFAQNETGADAFQGMGWMFMISESFPILAMIAFALHAKRTRKASWLWLAVALAAFFVAKLLFGGLRGSRSNTIWGLFWAVGIVHLTLRRVPLKVIAVGVALLVAFMYAYGFYKVAGLDAAEALRSEDARTAMIERSGRTIDNVVLGDLGRSDVQAYLLYRTSRPDSDYSYALGRTYAGALSLLIPRAIWPNRPDTKVREGTNAQYGARSYESGSRSSRVYGLAGEALLNFGPAGVLASFVLLGWAVGWVERAAKTWTRDDCRLLLLPFLVNGCFVLLVGDLDNDLMFFIKNGALPVLVLMLASRRVARPMA